MRWASSSEAGGAVSAFAIDPVTRNLRLLNEQATNGADPCHLSVDNRKRTLLVANYTGGNVSVFPLRSDGTLGMVAEVKQHEGSGPKDRKKDRTHIASSSIALNATRSLPISESIK